MGFFSKKKNIDVENVKAFLHQNGIEWDGAVIANFQKGQPFFSNIDNDAFNKIIKKPIRLLIQSEQYKGVDSVVAGISSDCCYLFNIVNNCENLDLTNEWIKFQNSVEMQNNSINQRQF